MNTTEMNKTIEYSFDVGIALIATILQIHSPIFAQLHVPTLDLYSLTLKFAVLGGSMSYVFKAMRDEKTSTRDGFFTAFTGYTFGIFAAPALTLYAGVDNEPRYTLLVHYLMGGLGMWVMNIGWNVMKQANVEAWPILKGWLLDMGAGIKTAVLSWFTKRKTNDEPAAKP